LTLGNAGVTVVQYRDKKSDTGAQIETARKLHRITQAHGVPLIINDRVDVALAVGAEGVHLGQDDMGKFQSAKLDEQADIPSHLGSKEASTEKCNYWH
jgi:thiamine-phosphate diphosphorylase